MFSILSSVIVLAIFSAPRYFDLNAARQANEAEKSKRGQQPATPATPATPEAAALEFREFFDPDPRELKPSARLLGLNGKRVRLVGFMAQMENPPAGAFYLCPRPVHSDESGGGTAELPVERVLVLMRSAKGKEVPFISRPIEVTGILEIGNREEEDGTVSAIRLILDGPETLPRPLPASPSKHKRKTSSKN